MTLLQDERRVGAPSPEAPPVLEIADLVIGYGDGRQHSTVVHGISISLHRGQTLALVGQSGSGKSTIALAAGGLLPSTGRIESGRVTIAGHDVTSLSRRGWRELRGNVVGFVPQDPLSSLDPLQTIGQQLGAALRLHAGASRVTVRSRTIALLDRVGIRDAAERIRSYPHELSGGQLQRVLIAIAIAGEPQLLIADEPTSALDVTVQKTILDLLAGLQDELGLALLFITHDLALAAERSDTVAVLNGGRLVESGDTGSVIERSSDPYTLRLFSDAPALSPNRYRSSRLKLRADSADSSDSAIEVSGLLKRYPGPRGSSAPAAVDGVSFAVRAGSIHALVGESGSGKTTIARIIAGLTAFDEGSVRVGDRQLPRQPLRHNRFASQLQLVYQNPLAALDPRLSVRQALEQPLIVRGERSASVRRALIAEILDQVSLASELLDRRPRELSGGQRQRVAIGRALMSQPEILVLDEPTSALDVTVQARIIELLFELRQQRQLSYLFISHDLSLVRQIADEVSVLDQGQLVESGPAETVFASPRSAYTRRLLDSIPGPRARR